MAQSSTLYRFKIELSDVDRSVYQALDLRVAMHPSETEEYLITRILAYALNYEDGLKFSVGLSEPDLPAIHIDGANGEILKWIDIGNPTVRRLHKSSKAARKVRIYTYKNPENLKKEMLGETIYRAHEIEIFAFSAPFLNEVKNALQRDNSWGLICNDGEIVVTAGGATYMGSMTTHRLD